MLQKVTLGVSQRVEGLELEEGMIVTFYPTGQPKTVWSPNEHTVAGFPLGPSAYGLELHPNGQPRYVNTPNNFEYQGLTLAGDDEYRHEFWDNGRVKAARLTSGVQVFYDRFGVALSESPGERAQND